jgi:hypothetical protein
MGAYPAAASKRNLIRSCDGSFSTLLTYIIVFTWISTVSAVN